MIINAGVRFDYFDPRSLSGRSEEPRWELAVLPAAPDSTMMPSLQKDPGQPRASGVSFPITDQGIIHFSYGHFFQIPGFEYLYQNPDYLVSSGRGAQPPWAIPTSTRSGPSCYELGLQQVLFGIVSLDVTAYYRDIRNYLGMEIIGMYEGVKYARLHQPRLRNVRGFIVSLDKRLADYFSVKADYTFQIAEGNSSDPVPVQQQPDRPARSKRTSRPCRSTGISGNTLNLTLMVGEPRRLDSQRDLPVRLGLSRTPRMCACRRASASRTAEPGRRRYQRRPPGGKAFPVFGSSTSTLSCWSTTCSTSRTSST